MLRALAGEPLSAAAGVCLRHGARTVSSSGGPGQEAAATKSSTFKKFLMAAIPIGVIAAVAEYASQGREAHQSHSVSAASAPSATPTSSGADDGSSHQGAGGAHHPHATIHGGVTSHGVEIDPSNPLHKLLPETECEFCLETREKLWGMMKGMKKAGGSSSGSSGSSGGKAKGSEAPQAAAAADAVSAQAVASPRE